MRILKLWLAGAVLIAGCSPARIPIDKGEIARLRVEANIPVITHKPEPFSFLSAGDHLKWGLAALALPLGGYFVGRHAESVARTQGEELLTANAVQDPAHKVRDQFLGAVSGQLNLNNFVTVHDAFATDDPWRMRDKIDTPLILDFKTYEWHIMPGMTSRYRLRYRLRSRLLRVADGTVLWRGDCRYEKSDGDATLEELTAHSGKLLHARMDEAAEFCAMSLLMQFLGQQ